MTDYFLERTEIKEVQTPWGFNPVWLLLGLFLVILAGGLGYWLNDDRIPAADSADVGFARDMGIHHQQAVEMSKLLYDRSTDEEIRLLAYDILVTQQAQIGMMNGWLDSWGHPWTDLGPKMEWMGMAVTGLMPGMATTEEMDSLRNATGTEADKIFLQLMILHHQAGVAMAEAAVAQATSPFVQQAAQSMTTSQTAEIEYMQELLQAKGGMAVPEVEDHSNMDHTAP